MLVLEVPIVPKAVNGFLTPLVSDFIGEQYKREGLLKVLEIIHFLVGNDDLGVCRAVDDTVDPVGGLGRL